MNYQKELEFASSLAYEAGKIMRNYFRTASLGTTWKKDDTPLTIADTEINRLVIERVKNQFPEHGILGEEESYQSQRQRVWVVDPIDGTMPYSLGMPFSTFSIALVDKADGQPVVAAVYDPQLNNLYVATKDGGAFLNDTKITVSQAVDLKNTYISVIGGIPKDGQEPIFKPGACSDLLRTAGAKVFCLISQAYSAAKVASGEFVASAFGFDSAWDSAAVCLLVREAGGVVTDVFGKERRYDTSGDGCLLSANQTIHSQLLKLVQASL